MPAAISEELIELRKRIWHSTAHVMADIVIRLFPDAKLAIGPPTEDGFYYDFQLDQRFSDRDLLKIEKQMKKTIQRNLPFEYIEYSRDDALRFCADEPMKLEIIEEIFSLGINSTAL